MWYLGCFFELFVVFLWLIWHFLVFVCLVWVGVAFGAVSVVLPLFCFGNFGVFLFCVFLAVLVFLLFVLSFWCFLSLLLLF